MFFFSLVVVVGVCCCCCCCCCGGGGGVVIHYWGWATQADMTLLEWMVEERREPGWMIKTLWRMIITKWLVPPSCPAMRGGLLSHVRVSHGRGGGGCILGGSYTGFTSCTGATATQHCPWAPLGPPWGLTWSPVTAGGYTLRGAGGKVPTIVEDISVRVSTSKELTCNKQWKEELELLLLTNG